VNDGSVRSARWTVSGRVQGVGFRWYVLKRAQELGVSGWVRNLPDGRVEAAASGDPEQLQAFEDALRRGPRFSRVDNLLRSDDTLQQEEPKGFEII